jgi:molybdopterin converting factor small subunit
MDVVVRCYGNVRETVGVDRVEVTVEARATVSDVLDAVATEYTDLDRLTDQESDLVVMRDGGHVDGKTKLAEGDLLNVSTPPMRD